MLTNKKHYVKVLLKMFHLNGLTTRFFFTDSKVRSATLHSHTLYLTLRE